MSRCRANNSPRELALFFRATRRMFRGRKKRQRTLRREWEYIAKSFDLHYTQVNY